MGKAAAIPASTVPAIEIETIGATVDDVDRGLLNYIGSIEGRLYSGTDVDRHGMPITRAQCECRSGRANVK
jgi:hypothetical protein